MQKEKTKKVAKHVGADGPVCPDNRGITLIALVITIIVMLILVGVSVTVALNGGLFSTAQGAAGTTEAEKENELALSDGRVEIGGSVYNSIEEYTNPAGGPANPEGGDGGSGEGVDLSQLSIGDYVNYPVNYDNVSVKDVMSDDNIYYARDEFTGWRVLSKEIDDDGNILRIKLISAGIPLVFQCDGDNNATALTTNFLSTEISNTYSNGKFVECGFSVEAGDTLNSTFPNTLTEYVQCLKLEDLDDCAEQMGNSAFGYGSALTDEKYNNLLAVPCGGEFSSYFVPMVLATKGEGFTLYATFKQGKLAGSDGSGEIFRGSSSCIA